MIGILFIIAGVGLFLNAIVLLGPISYTHDKAMSQREVKLWCLLPFALVAWSMTDRILFK